LDTVIYGGERWINITITNDEEWKGFCRVVGNPEWTGDEKFATAENRRQNHDELDKHIDRWTRTGNTKSIIRIFAHDLFHSRIDYLGNSIDIEFP